MLVISQRLSSIPVGLPTIFSLSLRNPFLIQSPMLPNPDVPRRRKKWTDEEDAQLRHLVHSHGTNSWREVSAAMLTRHVVGGVGEQGGHAHGRRDPKQCRERWMNHLDPTVRKGKLGADEWALLDRLHEEYGNKYALEASAVSANEPCFRPGLPSLTPDLATPTLTLVGGQTLPRTCPDAQPMRSRTHGTPRCATWTPTRTRSACVRLAPHC